MSRLPVNQHKRLRGLVLELVDANHKQQRSRYDDVALWSDVQDLGFRDVSLNDLLTVLQDLAARNYLKYEQGVNRRTGDRTVTSIEILPAGVDLVEKTTSPDKAVTIL